MAQNPLNMIAPQTPGRTWWKTILGVGLALIILAAATPWLVGPACPKRVVIATGSDVGAYYAFAQKYQALLESEGIQLEIRQTAGSVENAALLKDADSVVSLAIIQGGTAGGNLGPDRPEVIEESGIQSLASLFLEPIWVFYRKGVSINRLADLRGKRVVIGAAGSGTRAVALELLADNGLVPDKNPQPGKGVLTIAGANGIPPTTLLSLNSRDSAEALKAGSVDAAFFVLAPNAPLVGELMRDGNMRLFNFERVAAYERKHAFLSRVTISEGMLDLERNLPDRDIQLLAPTAVLVARTDLHPALVPLFLKAASLVHEGGGVLGKPREFPSEAHVEYPLNPNARRYLRAGPSFFYRTFPFSVAAWMDRMKLMLLPLFTLLIPLIKAAPPLYRWRIRSKIYTWYRVLRQVDQARRESDGIEVVAPFIKQLKQVERELSEISVPLSFMEEFYNLRWHVAFVLEQLERQQKETQLPLPSPPERANQGDIRQIPDSCRQISKAA